MINGVTELSMMKADVLDGFETIKACTHYMVNGERVDEFPYDCSDEDIIPVYEEIPGWNQDITGLTDIKDAPKALLDYIDYLETQLETKITVVSVGPNRKQTLLR